MRYKYDAEDLELWDEQRRQHRRPRRQTSLEHGDYIQFVNGRGVWKIIGIYTKRDKKSGAIKTLFSGVNIITKEVQHDISEYLLVGAKRIPVDKTGTPRPIEVGECVSVIYGGGRIEPGQWLVVGSEDVHPSDPNQYRKLVVQNVTDGRIKVFREYILRRV